MRATRRPAAAFLLAAAGLAAELAWTRLAGLLFFGEAAFLVVSLAVAGLALGAAAGAARPAWLRRDAVAAAAMVGGAALAAGAVAALALAGRGGPVATLALLLPAFAALGLAFAGLFAGDPRHAPRIYAADLVGAATGAALSVPLLGRLGAPDALLAAGAAACAAGAVLGPSRPRLAASALAVALAVAVAAPGPGLDPARLATAKDVTRELARGGELLAVRWGSVGRSDLVRRGDGAEVLYLDGGAGSLLPTPASAALWRGDPGRFAFEALRPRRVFVIGAGAGLEVTHALETGASEVLAAEVNGAGVDLARERLAALGAGGDPTGRAAGTPNDPFDDPRAAWRRDEARSVLRASGGGWNLIALSQAVTRTAEARGLALTENGLYTVEAMRAYLDATTPGGALAIEMYDELTLTRVLITVATALRESGRAAGDAEALDHLIALLDPGTTPPTPLLLAFAEAPARDAVVAVARAAEARGLGLLHLPGLLENPPLADVAAGERTLASLVDAAGDVDLAPVRDAAPFFWSFERGVPRTLRRLLAVLGVVTALLGPALIVARPRTGPAGGGTRVGVALAGLLGVAFLALELAVLSRTGLLLGHPAAALAVTLGGLLVGAGLGSAAARRRPEGWGPIVAAALVAGAAAAVWTLAWPPLAATVAASGPATRAALAAATLLPLGVALGAPFPLLLRRLGTAAGADAPGTVARAWALNGLGSLLGGTGATALAHLLGFDVVLIAAAGTYLAAAGLAASIRERPAPAPPA